MSNSKRNIVWSGAGVLVDRETGRELKHERGAKLTNEETELLAGQIDSLLDSRVLGDTAKNKAREQQARRRENAIRKQLRGDER